MKKNIKNFPHILNIKKNQANNSKSKYDFIFKLKKGDINLNSMNNLNSHDPKSEHNKFPNIKLNSYRINKSNDLKYKINTVDLSSINKYNPGYIYYKSYQNISEKLNKKKIKLKENKNKTNNEIRIKLGNTKNANNRYNNCLKYSDEENAKKISELNNDNISKAHKSIFFNNKKDLKLSNIYSYMINKNNPYSIYWANKLLNNNDACIGINFNSTVPLLKSLNIKLNSNENSIKSHRIEKNKKKLESEIKKIIRENKLKKNKLKLNIENEENNLYSENQKFNIQENKTIKPINLKDNKAEKKCENNEFINNINEKKDINEKEEEKQIEKNKEENKKEKKEKKEKIQKTVHDFTDDLFDEVKKDLNIEKGQNEEYEENEEEDKNKDDKIENDPLDFIRMMNNTYQNKYLNNNSENNNQDEN